MRIMVTGSRNLTDRKFVEKMLREHCVGHEIEKIVVGDCKTGADAVALAFAERLLFDFEVFKANWNKFGRSAGPIRNRQIVAIGRPDVCLAFFQTLDSKGTNDAVNAAKEAGVPVRAYYKGKPCPDKST